MKMKKRNWKYLRNTSAFIGAVMMFLGASTSDYYTTELGQAEPEWVWRMICVGFAMMIPAVYKAIITEIEGRKRNVFR